MIPVVWLAPDGCWDVNVLHRLFDNELFPTGLTFTHHERYPDTEGIILVVPGRYWNERLNEISENIAQYCWVLGIRTGDEENWVDVDRIVHPNIRWWVQTPDMRKTYGDVRKFGVGFTPHFNRLQPDAPELTNDVFLSAQATHPRRWEAFAAMNCMPGHLVRHETAGFTQGLAPELYAEYMIHSRIALAPAGPCSPDTFRLYEALESHCVPIADDICANYDSRGYWQMTFPDAPFPIITDWRDTPGMMRTLLDDYPRNANRIAAWWMREKRRYVQWLREDLDALGCTMHQGDDAGSAITAVIPVSPIPSHPSDTILDTTLESVRFWLPDSEIILTFDGVRPEQDDMRAAYEESIRRTLWRCDHHWTNVTPLIFDTHMHQTGMFRAALQRIDTPLLMYVEQDTPLVIDELIDIRTISSYLLDGNADLVRLHHEALVLDVHKHLMQERDGIFWRTTQWSQRPHIATKTFYTNAMQHFSDDAKCFIEEKLASVAQEQPYWRLFLYHPNDANIKRSYHLDGRAGGPKFEESQTF